MDYLQDSRLIKQLNDIGHDIVGYYFTKSQNESECEKGTLNDILSTRIEFLTKDIKSLIEYIKEKY